MASSSLFNLRAWQSFSIISLQVFFGLPLGLAPSTSYSNRSFLFATHAHTIATCFAVAPRLSCNPNLSLNPLLGTLFYLNATHPSNIVISARWSATSFSFLTGQVTSCNILLYTQLLYNLPLTMNDISLLVSNGTNCLNLFHPIRILVSTATSASVYTQHVT